MRRVENKVALVTSSTRGIGLAIAKLLAKEGARVYLAVRRMDAGEEVAKQIIAEGGFAKPVYFDASKVETHTTMIEEVLEAEGRLDILVNNYGATDVKKDFDLVNGDTEAFFKIVNQNLESVYLPCKAAVPAMI